MSNAQDSKARPSPPTARMSDSCLPPGRSASSLRPAFGSEAQARRGASGSKTIEPRRGFTLVELMVVLVIIAILVTVTVSFTGFFLSRAKVQKTRAIQAIVMNAVERFFEDVARHPGTNSVSTAPLYRDLAHTDQDQEIYSQAAIDAIAKLPVEALGSDEDEETIILDGFRRPMRYEMKGSMFSTPVLISAGKDGDFDTDDDIYSEEQQ